VSAPKHPRYLARMGTSCEGTGVFFSGCFVWQGALWTTGFEVWVELKNHKEWMAWRTICNNIITIAVLTT
jgi:hypothetical protein